jgi:hypothetical protein
MKKHAGSGKPQGVLSRGTKPQPSPLHGGTLLRKGSVKAVSTPASRQATMAKSWHGTVRK